MKKSYIILVVILGILGFIFLRDGGGPYLEQDLNALNENNDGKIVSAEKIDVLSVNEQFDNKKSDKLKEKIKKIDTYSINYLSSEKEAKAVIMKPKEEGNYPVLFFNRSAKVKERENERLAYWFTSFFSEDYIIVSPKYEGDYGGNQLEDFSASDSEQFLDLVKLTKSLPYVNENKMAAIGIEKGGQMVYQAIKNDVGLNAAAVFNTPTDLIGLYNDSISARKKVFEEKLGGTPSEIEEKYIAKSSYYWPEKIDSPLLILHYEESKNVKSIQAKKLVNKFNKIGYKDYKAIINSDMDWEFVINRSIEWIREKTEINLEM
ncbi:MAG TPA: prolyl oligopeptidase family serine peptidase [Halanaerobiales bacterium]|nr:prolyl oligopeptidase family serine peptidase [Halanaerobiales bacterium]